MPGGDVGAIERYTAPGYVQHNVEHWDNVEPVPPPEELVNSGKF